MSKKVLVLCTGNSCRSIIAEALINHTFNGQIEAHSSGVSASGKVNPNFDKQFLMNLEGKWVKNRLFEQNLEKKFFCLAPQVGHLY